MKAQICLTTVLAGQAFFVFAAGPPEPVFHAVVIDSKIEIGYGVAVADVDGDGKPDILLADKKQFVWYRNPSWEKFVLAENLTEKDNVCIAARDIDGDGKCEIAVGANWNPGDTVGSGSVHYLIPPADRTQKWEPVELPHEPTVHRMKWVKRADGKFDLVVVPLHGRGNKNGAGDGVKILAYKMPADSKQPWTTEVLVNSLHATHNFDPINWHDGSKQELLIAGKEGSFLWSHFGDKPSLMQLGGNEGGGAGEIRIGKRSDGARFFATVEPMHGNSLVVYSSPKIGEDRTSALWNRNVIDASLAEGHALACGDILGIGGDQIVVGWRAKDKTGKVGLKLFTALDADGKSWRTSIVDDNTMACEDLVLADLNGDGKLDIVASGRSTKNVKIYFNASAK
jgi:hypothetical protein